MTSKGTNENEKPVSGKIKTKTNLRGGDPDDVNLSNGKGLIQ